MRWLSKALAFGLVGLFMLPMVWLVYSAFIDPQAFYSGNPFALKFSFANFVELGTLNLFKPLMLSLVATSAVVLLQLLTSLPAAYALRGGMPLLAVFLFFLAIPTELMLVPLYGLLYKLHLLNSIWALIIPFAASPFMVFLLYQGLLKMPWAYVEAARLDGASEGYIMFKVMLPLLLPEIAAACVLAFAAHWNLVLYPKVMLPQELMTVQIALNDLMVRTSSTWGVLGAAALATSLPIVLLYAIFEKHVVKTFQGGVK